MDKPIHTLKEWHERLEGHIYSSKSSEILRDWGRDELILKAVIAELDSTQVEIDKAQGILHDKNIELRERVEALEKAEKVESVFTTSKVKLISVQKQDIDRLTKQNKILDEALETIADDDYSDLPISAEKMNGIAKRARQVAKEVE